MKKNFFFTLAIVCLTGFVEPVWAIDVPIGVKEQEVTAIYQPAPNLGGGYRPDGSDAWDYCIEDGCHYNPQVGDRVKVDAMQGWRMTFWNVGEMGGENKKMAKLEQVREFLNAGEVVTEVVPPLTADSFKSGITYSKIISEPATDIIEPYINPKYTFTLGFTGGPNGVFWEINGERQHPSGKEIRGDVKKGDDDIYYIQMSGAFSAQLKIDDPKVFDGFVESWDNANVIWEGGYSYGFSDYGGEVWVEDSEGEAYSAEDFSGSSAQQISEGMVVKTGLNSYAVIQLNSEGARLVVGPNSQVKMKRPESGFFDTNMGRMILKVKRNVELMIKEGRMEVIMNQAVAGRKGTVAVFVEEEGKSTVKVLEGEMYLKANVDGESQDIKSGQMLSADKNGLSELQTLDIEQELKLWEEIVPKAVVDDVRQTIVENVAVGASTVWWKTSYLWYVLIGLGIIVILAVIIIVAVFKKKK